MQGHEYFKEIKYKITDEKLELAKYHKNIPKEVKKNLPDILKNVSANPQKAVDDLKNLVDRYSSFPILYNYLSAAYMNLSQEDMAEKYIKENYKKNPEYLFAKVNYADLCIMHSRFHEVPKIFGHQFELGLLYPERYEFHVTEIVGFYSTMAMYFCHTREPEQAKRYYKVLKEVAPRHPKVRQVKKLLYPSLIGTLWLTGKALVNKVLIRPLGFYRNRERDGNRS